MKVARKENLKDKCWVMQVTPEGEKPHYFRFYGKEAETSSATVLQLLLSNPSQVATKFELLGNDALVKLSALAEDPNLMQLFSQLVINEDQPKTWQEHEFWEVYKQLAANITLPQNNGSFGGEIQDESMVQPASE